MTAPVPVGEPADPPTDEDDQGAGDYCEGKCDLGWTRPHKLGDHAYTPTEPGEPPVRSYREYRKRYFPGAVEAERRANQTPQEAGERIARDALAAASVPVGEPADPPTCENCGKPMAEHGPMANCYPPTGRWTVDQDGRLVYPLPDEDYSDPLGQARAIYIGPGTFGVLWTGVTEPESRAAHVALAAVLNGEATRPTAEQIAERVMETVPMDLLPAHDDECRELVQHVLDAVAALTRKENDRG